MTSSQYRPSHMPNADSPALETSGQAESKWIDETVHCTIRIEGYYSDESPNQIMKNKGDIKMTNVNVLNSTGLQTVLEMIAEESMIHCVSCNVQLGSFLDVYDKENNVSTIMCHDCVDCYEEEALEYSASEASASTSVEEDDKGEQPKVFEFVRADNLLVIFNQKGTKVTVGWSKADFRFYILVDGKKAQLTSAQTVINKFKKFHDGVHGDIARIVKALVHLKTKPSMIVALERKEKQQNVSVVSNKEKASATKPSRMSKYVAIDPTWLADYKATMGEDYDARLVRSVYDNYLASVQ